MATVAPPHALAAAGERRSVAAHLGWVAAWAAVAVFFASLRALETRYADAPVSFAHAVGASLVCWGLWAILGRVVLRLLGRWPLAWSRLAGSLPRHLLAALGLAIVHLALLGPLLRLLPTAWGARMVPSQLHLNLLTYAVLVGLSWGLAERRLARERELDAARLAGSLAETRLAMLQAQLQPHFLFNTLNAIAELVHADPDAAEATIARLGDCLRASLQASDGPTWSLAHELELLDSYLAIERTRLGPRLEIELNIDDDARDHPVPRLLLQPLVENAIRHGVARRTGPARLELSAARDGDELVVVVTNPGSLALRGDDGVGLANTRERLAHAYGDAAELTLEEQDRERVVARLRLPPLEP